LAIKATFGKPVQTDVYIIHAQLTRTEKNGLSWKVPYADESFPRSQNRSCTSSRILAIARQVENEFRKNASFLLKLREISLELNFKRLKVVY